MNWNKHKPKKGHGTVVVLMGKSLEDNSWVDAEGKPYSVRGISHYLNQRYAYIPKHTKIRVLKGSVPQRVCGLLQSFRASGFLKSQSFVECPDGFQVEVLITEKHSTWKDNHKSSKSFGGSSPFGGGSPFGFSFGEKREKRKEDVVVKINVTLKQIYFFYCHCFCRN